MRMIFSFLLLLSCSAEDQQGSDLSSLLKDSGASPPDQEISKDLSLLKDLSLDLSSSLEDFQVSPPDREIPKDRPLLEDLPLEDFRDSAQGRDASEDLPLDFPPDQGGIADLSSPEDQVSLEDLQGPLRFRFPIHDDDRNLINPRLVFGFDHDPADNDRIECLNYAEQSFPFCYNEHDGSDFLLSGGFARMDQDSARIVSAADGEVLSVEDGHYDRCHADVATMDISCDGHEMRANFVKLQHPDGWQTWYYHLRSGSVAVEPGDYIGCGEVLGLVGSSGYSSSPHLHFEVRSPQGGAIDPYSGVLNVPASLWLQQDSGDGLPGERCDPRGEGVSIDAGI